MINSSEPPWHLPVSQTFAIRDTAVTGRAVFAEVDVSTGCHLLTTSPDFSPLVHVILRPYRREVCAWCLLYDRGREWKGRKLGEGVAFCSTQCEVCWDADNDETCRQAGRSIENIIKVQSKRKGQASSEKEAYIDATPLTARADSNNIAEAWVKAEEHGAAVVRARIASKPSKTQRAILRHATEVPTDPDLLTYVLSGVLAAYKAWVLQSGANDSDKSTNADDLLPSLFELVPDDKVFSENVMTASPLHDYTSAYLVLLALMPIAVLPLITSKLVINLASRAAHNAFSIRPEGMTDGDESGEFLGWGVWPEASFFNHSCSPNVKKERRGRLWAFGIHTGAGRVVRQGQQLCITYLGGDEKDLDVSERRQRLQEQWGFRCLCDRCLEESGET